MFVFCDVDIVVRLICILSHTNENTENQASYEEYASEMLSKFIIGSTNGHFIGSMEILTQQIFPSAFNNQFQDPQTANNISFELDDEYAACNTGNVKPKVYVKEEGQQQKQQAIDNAVHTSRPSDFRLKAILCAHTKIQIDDNCRERIVNAESSLRQIDCSKEVIEKKKKDPNEKKKTKGEERKSMQKLFDEFIVELNKSIEWYDN